MIRVRDSKPVLTLIERLLWAPVLLQYGSEWIFASRSVPGEEWQDGTDSFVKWNASG
jgi:hypothetical protein